MKKTIFLLICFFLIASPVDGSWKFVLPDLQEEGFDYYTSLTTISASYLKLDCSNDPLTNTLDGANFDFTGHGALGTDATVSATTLLGMDETLTTIDTTLYGILAQLDYVPAGALSAASHLIAMDMQAHWNGTVDGSTHASVQGIKGEGVNISDSGTGDIKELVGVYGKASNIGAANVTDVIGGLFSATNDDGFGDEDGAITNAYSILSRAKTDKTTDKITNRYGLYIEDTTGGGLLDNQYGLYIPALTAGGTINYGAVIMDDVGIGTATPVTNLQVQEDKNGTTNIEVTNLHDGDETLAGFACKAHGVASASSFLSCGTSYDGGATYGNALGHFAGESGFFSQDDDLVMVAMEATAGIRFYTGGALVANERMRIDKDGKVGIGATAVDEMLHIEGGDVKIEDDSPHLELETTTAGHDDFEITTHGNRFWIANLDDTKKPFMINEANLIQFYEQVGFIFPDAAPTDNQILKYDAALGRMAFEADATAAGGEWTDTGTILHPNEQDADSIAIGGVNQALADIWLGVTGGAVFNQQKNDVDFWVEGNTDSYMLYVDAGNDRVGIATNTPSVRLEVEGAVSANSIDGNTLIVSANSAYTTITLAMAAAAAGDTILVAEGSYSEAVTFSQDNLTLKAFGSAENTTITQAAGTTVDFSTKSGCVLDGFTVALTAATNATDEAIYSNNDDASDYNIVKNCTITSAHAGGSTIALMTVHVDDGNFRMENCDVTTAQSNNQATYATDFRGAHTHEFDNVRLTVAHNPGAAKGAWGLYSDGTEAHFRNCTVDISGDWTLAGAVYGIYGAATTTYEENNNVSVVTSATGVATALYTNDTTSYVTGNTVHATTSDSDAIWGNFGAGTNAYVTGNNISGDGKLTTGVTNLYEGGNHVNGVLYVNHLDTDGAADMDYGSADVTDHTFVSDGGTAIIDGEVVTSDANGAASTTDGGMKYDRTTETLEIGDGTNTRAIYTDGGIVFIIDGGGSAITTGAKVWLPMLKTGTLTGWDLTVDTSATITIDVWDDTYANFPPDNADTMTGGHEPAIAGAIKATDADISDWGDVVVTKDEYVRINVDANDNATFAVLWLKARWE